MSNARHAPSDRSVPRAALKSGDFNRDGRGRVRAMPPILHYGFRPFFFFGALHAAVAVPLWLAAYSGGLEIAGPFSGMRWHVHEMLFGYLAAIVAGFILTAVPNWTGRLPLSGRPLAALLGLWFAGRLACLLVREPYTAMAIDLAFPVLLALAIWREVIAGKNWRNTPVAVMVTLFGIANLTDHLGNAGIVGDSAGQTLAMAVIAMLIALIGGRIVPSFTRNWLVKDGASRLPASTGRLDKAALMTSAIALAGWVAMPDTVATGVALVLAGVLIALRLARWCGMSTFSAPIVFILHLGYFWLSAALILLGLAMLTPVVPVSAAIHALTAGAVGTMTLAVMTRASLGHTGRDIRSDRAIAMIYIMVSAGALLRVTAPFLDAHYLFAIILGGALWSGAFLLFAVRFAPVLWGQRKV